MRFKHFFIGLFISVWASYAYAAPTAEDFFKNPAYLGVKLSSDGQTIGTLASLNGRMNLVTVDLETRKATPLTGYDNLDVVDFHWIGKNRLVFTLGNLNEPSSGEFQKGGGLFAINKDGSDAYQISDTISQLRAKGQFRYRGHFFVNTVEDSETDIYTISHERSAKSLDIYRVNTSTGKKELLSADSPGEVHKWVLDHKGVPRVAVSGFDDASQKVFYRDAAEQPWKEIANAKVGESILHPLAFDYDDATLYVASDKNRDTAAVYKFNPRNGELGEQISQNPKFDINSGLVFNKKTKKLAGIQYQAEKLVTEWIDPDYAKLQKSFDKALPDTVNVFRKSDKSGKFIVTSYSDIKPVEWLLFDDEKKTLEPLLASMPWIKPSELVEMKPVYYQARDGTEIFSYLFLPKNLPAGKKPPLIVNVHGGPHVRADYWTLRSYGALEAQFFASKGYAVILPNFRMTPGLGKKIYWGGLKQFGKVMQEDVEDAVAWTVKQGYADADRVCISGSSYGGYATLMGVAKTPNLYKCGVAGFAVADLEMLITSPAGDIPYNKAGLAFWKVMVGDPAIETDVTAMRAVSPTYLADRIKAPIYLVSGADDYRVPLEHAQKMRAALRKAGKEPKWMVKENEAHGFGKVQNRVEMYNSVMGFFDEHIGKAKE